jgi:hypothetical protein
MSIKQIILPRKSKKREDMDAKVIYDSKFGNTTQIARTISDEIAGATNVQLVARTRFRACP